MGIGDRITGWVEERQAPWGGRLGGWFVSWIRKLTTGSEENLEDIARAAVRELLSRLTTSPEVPAELNPVREQIERVGGLGGWLYMELIILLQALPVLVGGSQPLANLLRYSQDRVKLSSRLDPLSVITAWRRDAPTYEKYFEDLREQGWSEGRIEALKFVTQFYPGPQDLVTWLAREVFEPDMIERYGLDDEAPLAQVGLFEKAGVNQEQMLNYWRAHWEHASFMQVVEMLHRGLLTLDKTLPKPPTTPEEWARRDAEGTEALFEWYRLVEIPPFWRDRLTEMSWNIPTRVDVRRWWEMRTIPEQELYNIYHRQGYHGEDLENYVRWTKVYTEFPSLIARWQKGWLTIDDVRQELIDLGIPSDRVEVFIQEKVKPEEPGRVEEGRSLTKSEVYKGVKKGVLTRSEGVELIMDLGYSLPEAEYLLSINVETLAGSPESFADFKELTSKWQRATGKEVPEMPAELKQAAAELVRMTNEVKTLQEALAAKMAEILDEEALPAEERDKLAEARVALNRAIAEKERLNQEYQRQLATWRQQAS